MNIVWDVWKLGYIIVCSRNERTNEAEPNIWRTQNLQWEIAITVAASSLLRDCAWFLTGAGYAASNVDEPVAITGRNTGISKRYLEPLFRICSNNVW